MSEDVNLSDPSAFPESIHEMRRRRLAEIERDHAGMLRFLAAIIKKYGKECEDALGNKRVRVTLTDLDIAEAPDEIVRTNDLVCENAPEIQFWVRP